MYENTGCSVSYTGRGIYHMYDVLDIGMTQICHMICHMDDALVYDTATDPDVICNIAPHCLPIVSSLFPT